MSDDSGPAWIKGFKEDYKLIFMDEWSPYLGATLIVIIMAVLMHGRLIWVRHY